ncbi:tripartite tricarboxylate transporter substrate-binding protein [Acidovorax sp. JHL-9]|uniref:tripartite tricarboxylate transporter substrate-binding protein n=1 Tax=Acidovorax sp. JHL-9 TaxID=1276756 RepID=UPI00047DF1BB
MDRGCLANAQSGIKSIDDLRKAASSAVTGLDIGIPAVGSPAHVLSAAVSDRLGLKATLVPLAGEPGGVTSLLANQVPTFVFLVGSAQQYIEKGQMVPLLAFTRERLPELPQVPTVVEVFGDAQLAREGWLGVTTKAGSPPNVARSLELWTKRCLETPEFQQAVRRSFFHPRFAGHVEFNKIVDEDIAFWSDWIRKLRITND